MDITTIITAVIALIGAAVSTFLIPWLRARIGAENVALLAEWAGIAVAAAEQIYAGPGRGEEKKKFALDFLAARGIKVDPDAIDAAIEAAVSGVRRGSV